MKTPIFFAVTMVACLACLFVSCSNDGGSEAPVSNVYDLRTLSQITEEFVASPSRYDNPVVKRKVPETTWAWRQSVAAAEFRGSLLGAAGTSTETYIYTYGKDAHLFWISATGTDADGNPVESAAQVLDSKGFPERATWYDSQGNFAYAVDYTYDENLYLKKSEIYYLEDPAGNPNPKKSFESYNEWNSDGVLMKGSGVQYDPNGNVFYEFTWRSVTVRNSLRGGGGFGFSEYFRQYNQGILTYQEESTFDADGYPAATRIDENGDGIFEKRYYVEVTETGQGYLESAVWLDDNTGEKERKIALIYDEEGLLQKNIRYALVNGDFVADSIVTNVWYRNPVDGPTGGIGITFESDEEGNPVGEYMTVEWTPTFKVHNIYAMPGEKSMTVTETLEKIRIQ